MSNYEKAIEELKSLAMEMMLSSANLVAYIQEVESYKKDGDPDYLLAAATSIERQRRDYKIAKKWYDFNVREIDGWDKLVESVKEEKGL